MTNERQRLYALESRKSRMEAKANEESRVQPDLDSEHPSDDTSRSKKPPRPSKSRESQSLQNSTSPFLDVDPKLRQYHYDVQERSPSEGQYSAKPTGTNGFSSAFPIKAPDASNVKYLINIMKDGHRIKPRFALTPITCPGFPSLVQHIQSVMDDGRGTSSIQVLGPNGLIDVNDQPTWIAAIDSIKQTEWMDAEVRCVVTMQGD